MKTLIMPLLILSISCSNIMTINEKITPVDVKINILGLTDENVIHVYLQNTQDRNLSFGKNVFDLTNDFTVNLFPGKYNIYFYGLNDKTATTKKVYSTKMIKGIDIYQPKELVINPDILTPVIDVESSDENRNINITMNDLYEILSLSAFSVKQGSEKLKSFDYEYDEYGKKYISSVPDIKGIWYANLSYTIKSKIDDKVLKKDNISISTSYFSNLNIGDF